MPINTLDLGGTWKLTDVAHGEGENQRLHLPAADVSLWMDAPVPGDVHPVLLQAGRIPDPFHGLNASQCGWVAKRDWWYRREFVAPVRWRGKPVRLVFDGVDTFAHLYVNGERIGEMDNMFRQYRFDITDRLRYGEQNTIAVCIRAPYCVLEARDSSKYFGCFYRPRIFARKAQCHFSWDWAPQLPAVGIWQDVRLEAVQQAAIDNVYVTASTDGHVCVRVNADAYSRRAHAGADSILVEIADGSTVVAREKTAAGVSSFVNLRVPHPKLWWPNGYGDPHLYNYTVTLSRGSATLDVRRGRFGFREARLVEAAKGPGHMGFGFNINGVDIFSLGANWVPADCFPATATDDRYAHLIRLAKEANFNMLRVWGGGLYEKDVFYDLCDEHGIMVWQDLMFACSDIPDDDPQFVMSVMPEFEYQVKRLRNHPCLVHWCGSNEKTGAFGAMRNFGDVVVRIVGRGVVNDLMPEATYTPSSPYSYTDIGNDPNSGDSHGGCYEQAFVDDICKIREHVGRNETMFNSEFGMHGPCQLESLKKFMPHDKLWPLNDVWEAHVQDNPYNSLQETFVQIQEKCAAALFHQPQSASDFVKAAGAVQAEILREEMEHHRRRYPLNGGALVWMLNDCWPCASWSLVDYYGIPKQAYYALKRACAPILPSFKKVHGGFELYLTTNLLNPPRIELKVEVHDIESGPVAELFRQHVDMAAHESRCLHRIRSADVPKRRGLYLCATFDAGRGDGPQPVTYFPHLWRDVPWPEPGLSIRIAKDTVRNDEHIAAVTLQTERYARCVNLTVPEGARCYLSDNFFDMIPGQTKTVELTSPAPIDPETVKLNHWLTHWE